MVILSIAAGFILPILLGGAAHYALLLKTGGRRRFLAEATGWTVTLICAVLLFPRVWRGMEYFTLSMFLLDVLVQVLLNVICQPVAAYAARRRLAASG